MLAGVSHKATEKVIDLTQHSLALLLIAGQGYLVLASGVHPKVASERLGHSKVGITLDLYSHVMPGMQEDAVAKVDAAFRAARKPS